MVPVPPYVWNQLSPTRLGLEFSNVPLLLYKRATKTHFRSNGHSYYGTWCSFIITRITNFVGKNTDGFQKHFILVGKQFLELFVNCKKDSKYKFIFMINFFNYIYQKLWAFVFLVGMLLFPNNLFVKILG